MNEIIKYFEKTKKHRYITLEIFEKNDVYISKQLKNMNDYPLLKFHHTNISDKQRYLFSNKLGQT